MNAEFSLLFTFILGAGLLFGFGLLTKLLKRKKTTDPEYFPYIKKESVMTRAEQQMFRKLEAEYGDEYYIFPQINLDKLVKITDQSHFYHYFNKINRKSVDFILVDKRDLRTELVIELDDYTHRRANRQNRDTYVNKVLSFTGYKYLHTKLY